MATTTTNYGYNISDGADLVNPLTDIFPNFTAIDGDLKAVSDTAITTATELKTGTVHALTRTDADRDAIRFTATANFTAGETFTVDGVQVTALTTSGEALTTGAYIIGSEVFAILKGTLLTMFVSQNITDADTLDGHDSTYFATDSDMDQAQQDISDLSTKVGTAVLTTTAQDCSGAINEINANLSKTIKWRKIWTNTSPTSNFASQNIPTDGNDYDFVKVYYTFNNNSLINIQNCVECVKGKHPLLTATTSGSYGPVTLTRYSTSTVDTSYVKFGDCYIGSGGTETQNNASLIPTEIYLGKLE